MKRLELRKMERVHVFIGWTCEEDSLGRHVHHNKKRSRKLKKHMIFKTKLLKKIRGSFNFRNMKNVRKSEGFIGRENF